MMGWMLAIEASKAGELLYGFGFGYGYSANHELACIEHCVSLLRSSRGGASQRQIAVRSREVNDLVLLSDEHVLR